METKELINKKKDQWLKDNLPYSCYIELIDFDEIKLAELYDEIHDDDFSYADCFKIVERPMGGKCGEEDSDYEKNKTTLEVWINQTCNGGYTGDDFSGDAYVKIKEGIYLTWVYSC